MSSEPVDAGAPPAAGACLAGDPNCQDTVGTGDEPADEFPEEAIRAGARDLLGRSEADFTTNATLRIGRRGSESFALTEDYVLGRYTVELDDDGTGTYVVTKVIVEMEGGPETFEA